MSNSEVLQEHNRKINNNNTNLDTILNAVNELPTNEDSFYDTFWDNFQNYGKRTNYAYAFYGEGWNDETFKPKYIIKPTYTISGLLGSSYVFSSAAFSEITDEFLDLSGVKQISNMMTDWKGKKISLTVTDVKVMTNAFRNGSYTDLTLYDINPECTFSNFVIYCYNLVNFTCTGTIGTNIQFKQSPLTNESVQKIIDCLKDLTGGTAQTLTLHADVKAKLTEEQIAAITAKNWTLA